MWWDWWPLRGGYSSPKADTEARPPPETKSHELNLLSQDLPEKSTSVIDVPSFWYLTVAQIHTTRWKQGLEQCGEDCSHHQIWLGPKHELVPSSTLFVIEDFAKFFRLFSSFFFLWYWELTSICKYRHPTKPTMNKCTYQPTVSMCTNHLTVDTNEQGSLTESKHR